MTAQTAKAAVLEHWAIVAPPCIRTYATGMRRITISLDDDLAGLAEAEVSAGRSPSLSAWVADAIRAKARARADLITDLEGLEQGDPTSAETVAAMARVLGLSRTIVTKAVRVPRRRPGGRSAA